MLIILNFNHLQNIIKHTVNKSTDEMINLFAFIGNISFSRKMKLNLLNHDKFAYRRFERHYTINKLVMSTNLIYIFIYALPKRLCVRQH